MEKIRTPRMISNVGRSDYFTIALPAVKIVTLRKEDGMTLEEKMNGMEFKGRYLIAKRIEEKDCDENG